MVESRPFPAFTCRKCRKDVFGFNPSAPERTCTCDNISDQVGIAFPCGTCKYNKSVFGNPCCRLPSKHGCADCPNVTREQKMVLDQYKEGFDRRYSDFPSLVENIADVLITTVRERYPEGMK